VANNVTFSTATRSGSGKCAIVSSADTPGNLIQLVFGQRVASAFIGFAVKMPQGGNGYGYSFWDSVNFKNQCTVWFRGDNYSIQIYRGNAPPWTEDGTVTGTLLYTSPNNAWTPDTWFFLELWATIDPSAGAVKVYINNILTASVTGVNTQVSTASQWDVSHWHTANSSMQFDDFYYGDTTTGPGTYPGNVPLGDCGTYTLFPVGNDAVQFTPLALTNWQEVSETAMDGDTSYNFDDTVGQEDLLNLQALPAGVVLIYGVQVTGAYRKDDTGARAVKQALKSGATEQYGASYSLPQTYVYYTDPWILDPNTSANWTVTAVNGVAAGYNVAS
jgi:hypothetical protein